MLFGLNESSLDTTVEVEALIVPKHLDESILGISAYGQAQAEKIYETALELHGKFVTTLQRGISEGKLSEAVETILQEGALSGFFGKIKDFLKKIWATIKGMFEKFMAWLDSKMKSDKDFIAKYKKILSQKASKVSDLQYKGHEWNITDYPTDIGSEITELTAMLAGANIAALKAKHEEKGGDAATKVADRQAYERAVAGEAKSDGSDRDQRIKDTMTGISKKLQTGNLDDADEIAAEYKEKLYGGEADTQSGPNVNSMIAIVEGYDKDRKAAEKAFKALDKELNKGIKDMEKAEKEAAKDTDNKDMKASTIVAVLKEVSSVINKTTSIYLQALKDRRDESRAVLAKVVTYKGE